MEPLPFKLHDRVYDRWFLHWGTGVVVKTTKSTITVKFSSRISKSSYVFHKDGKLVYDRPHMQFLKRVAKKRTAKKTTTRKPNVNIRSKRL